MVRIIDLTVSSYHGFFAYADVFCRANHRTVTYDRSVANLHVPPAEDMNIATYANIVPEDNVCSFNCRASSNAKPPATLMSQSNNPSPNVFKQF